MKVLFLDIDGVINTMAELGYRYCFGERIQKLTERSMIRKYEKNYPFDPTSLYHLYRIVEETGCKIVVSSTWRLGRTNEQMKSWFADSIIKDSIIDKTPDFSALSHPHLKDKRGYVQRGEEIYDWLQRHPEVTAFAVLDDDGDMDAVRGNFFQTDTYDGLDRKTANKVIGHLNKKEYIPNQYRLNVALGNFKLELDECMEYISREDREKLIRHIGETITNWRASNG